MTTCSTVPLTDVTAVRDRQRRAQTGLLRRFRGRGFVPRVVVGCVRVRVDVVVVTTVRFLVIVIVLRGRGGAGGRGLALCI